MSEARVIIEERRIDYNCNRAPNRLRQLAPADFTAQWITLDQPKAAQRLDRFSAPLTSTPRITDRRC